MTIQDSEIQAPVTKPVRRTGRTHRLFVWLHRWVGLAMAAFLILEGVTGSMLAFRGPLTQFFDPALFSQPASPSAQALDLASLIELNEQRFPAEKFHWFLPLDSVEGVVLMAMIPRHEAPTESHGVHEGLVYHALDPWTGREVRRMDAGLYSKGVLPNVMPFVYELHKDLALGRFGTWVLSLTALLWTLDCFAGVYLTFPLTLQRFWSRWKPSWLIKTSARAPRVNLDIHRSFSLWLWLALLIFAWSSVGLVDNLNVYNKVNEAILGPQVAEASPRVATHSGPPALDWHQALARGKALATEASVKGGFTVGEPNGLWYSDDRMYTLRVDTSRRFPEYRYLTVSFDADSGAPLKAWGFGYPDSTTNALVSDWIMGFHMITDPFEYTTYRVLIVLFGLTLAAISVTGVVVWYYKRRARLFQGQPRASSLF